MTNNTVQQIEQAITQLTPAELDELYSWLAEYQPEPVDERIAASLHAGLLDKAILRAVEDADNKRTTLL